MVYAALPTAYLDPQHWNQQSQEQLQQGFQAGGNDHGVDRSGDAGQRQLETPLPSQPGGGADATNSAKPLSTADRARLAKLPQPDAAPVRCPRCDSANTKFCYFNNYSLSQPRHFCKACRRYWTRGGALRNVPVGGGCRRNKRTKGSGISKGSSAASSKNASAAANSLDGGGCGAVNTGISIPAQFSFLASLHQLPEYAAAFATTYGGIAADPASYHTSSSTGIGPDQWINSAGMQHFPFLTGMEPPHPPLVTPPSLGLGHPETSTVTASHTASGLAAQLHDKSATFTGLTTPLPAVKMEGALRQHETMSFARPQHVGIPGVGNNQYWVNTPSGQEGRADVGESTAPWMCLSGFTSSSVNLH